MKITSKTQMYPFRRLQIRDQNEILKLLEYTTDILSLEVLREFILQFYVKKMV